MKLFEHKFKECEPKFIDLYTYIGGFGEGEVKMPVYEISNFELTDGKNKILFRKLYIAIEENRNRNFDLLFTYPMFKNVSIAIRPTSKNRYITFAVGEERVLDSFYITNKKNEIIYTESHLQFTSQDYMANYVNEQLTNDKDKKS